MFAIHIGLLGRLLASAGINASAATRGVFARIALGNPILVRGQVNPGKVGADPGELNIALFVNSDGWELSAGEQRTPSMGFDNFIEEIQVLGRDLVDKVRDLIHEGNVQRIVIKDEHGNTFIEIPVIVAAVGAILAPLLAALGAISALVSKFTIVVVRSEPKPPKPPEGGPPAMP